MRWTWPKGKKLSEEHRLAISLGAKAITNAGRFGKRLPRTHCKKGHPYDENTPVYRGGRKCRVCYKTNYSGIPRPKRTPLQALFREYQKGARERNLSWELTEKQFETLVFSACYYTGRPASRIRKFSCGEIIYNGIDRLNNKIGYVWENCVPCCSEINMMKKTLSYNQFISLCKEVTFPKTNFAEELIEEELCLL